MDKKELVKRVLEKLEEERVALAQAARNTYEAATHEESEAEDQYDTRGLEASYLAGAQAKRVAEVEQFITMLKFLEAKDFDEETAISATALVELDHDGKTTWVFLLPKGGGMTVEFEGHAVQIVTPKSPMGEALVGRHTGDLALVDTGKETREYEIVSVR
ncbi:MAG: GreA/GreB family elongation factor [Bdellovibrionota bacterium]